MPLPPAASALLADTALSFVPADGIVLASATPAAARFALLSPDFGLLQLAMTQVLSLPANRAEFEHRYGDFDAYQADPAMGAVDEMRRQGAVFGNPALLADELSKFGAADKPSLLYGQLVWLAHQGTKTANKFRFALESLPDDLTDTTDQAKRLRILKRVLTGEKGLTVAARQMVAGTRTLAASLLHYQPQLLAAQSSLSESFGKNTSLYKSAAALNPTMAGQLAAVQQQTADLNSQYTTLATVGAAATALLFVVVPVVGMLVAAVGVGTMLFDLQQSALRGVDQLEAQVRAANAETWKKMQLVADINALESALPPLQAQFTTLLQSLESLAAAWEAAARQLEAIADSTTAADLADAPAYLQRLQLVAAQQKWMLTARLTTDFTTNAFLRIISR
ncbi:hypothetical protein [Hymenobacter lucidus]|uniref:Alpha-xenorhabdolysin family binary toxin subunit A n=1 Tax=Hymenobacter lucidus TaxID=2880930 RepID=A0ABS8APT2_9BACT|nr:hypothetical protein [Hymenobacter lucidus]MCB2408028.1 hypothetical protein [Hymenobacter lucidus]